MAKPCVTGMNGDVSRRAYLVGLFAHVEPRPRSAGVLLRDGWRMVRLFAAVIEQ